MQNSPSNELEKAFGVKWQINLTNHLVKENAKFTVKFWVNCFSFNKREISLMLIICSCSHILFSESYLLPQTLI